LLTLLGAAAITPALAQPVERSATESGSPWTIAVGMGVARATDYEGGKKVVSGIVPDVNISYKLGSLGKISLGSKARGLTWSFIDTENYSLGVVVQGDGGRTDRNNGTLLRPGSKRLAGMGEISPSVELGVTGHFLLGAPIYFVATRGSGDGKPKGSAFKVDGHGGTRVEVGLDIPLQPTDQLTLSLTPNVQWADDKYTQTYFGVTSAQAARSGFRAYTAKGGIKSAGLALGANYKFDKHWSVNSGVSLSSLRGDAAKSPLVQRKNQTNVTAGFAYEF
jgi:MipA family protein